MTVRLEKAEALGRLIRKDKIEKLAIPTWELVREAIVAGRIDEALTLLDYCYSEVKTIHDGLCSLSDDALTRLAGFDEQEVYKFVRRRYGRPVRQWLSQTPGVKESLQRSIEYQRGHGGSCTISDEPDRYVVRCDPCGSGGQLRRTKEVGRLKKAYPWTWDQKDIPCYCVHCCVMWEILPIEIRGYPIRVNLIGKRTEHPCVHLYYKKPEAIPEEYFARVGKSKTC